MKLYKKWTRHVGMAMLDNPITHAVGGLMFATVVFLVAFFVLLPGVLLWAYLGMRKWNKLKAEGVNIRASDPYWIIDHEWRTGQTPGSHSAGRRFD